MKREKRHLFSYSKNDEILRLINKVKFNLMRHCLH